MAIVLVAVTYVLLVFGSTVRINEAGLACPDWPMCYGQVVPSSMDLEILLEWGHRVLAGGVSLGFVALGVLIVSDRVLRRSHGLWWVLAGVVLAVQIVLGGLTVLELLAEWTVTSHLLAGNTFCLLLLVAAITLWRGGWRFEGPSTGAPERAVVLLLAGAVLTQLALGGLVASSHAGLACGQSWPNCGGSAWFPTFQGIVGLQVIHRIGAYVLLGVAVLSAIVMRLRGRAGIAAVSVLAVVLGQASLGVANVWLGMPGIVTAGHSAGAALCVLTTTWLVVEVWGAPSPVAPAATPEVTPAEAP